MPWSTNKEYIALQSLFKLHFGYEFQSSDSQIKR